MNFEFSTSKIGFKKKVCLFFFLFFFAQLSTDPKLKRQVEVYPVWCVYLFTFPQVICHFRILGTASSSTAYDNIHITIKAYYNLINVSHQVI